MSDELIHYPIAPCPAPRMTRADRWKKRPAVLRYFAFRDEVRLHKIEISETLRVIFDVPMPASWSEKKRTAMEGSPHQSRPDLDNYVKALLDSVLSEDGFVHTLEAHKRWERVGGIWVGVGDETEPVSEAEE